MSATGFGLFVGVRGDGKVPELFRLGREEFADAAAGGRAGAWTAVRSCESGNTAGVCSATSRGVTRDDRRVARRPRGPGSRADSAGDDHGLEIHRRARTFLAPFLDWPSAPPSAAGSAATEVAESWGTGASTWAGAGSDIFSPLLPIVPVGAGSL